MWKVALNQIIALQIEMLYSQLLYLNQLQVSAPHLLLILSHKMKKNWYSASQGHTRLHDDEKCDSSHLYASHIPVKAKPVESSRLAGTIKSKISEDPYNRLRKDDKIDCRASTETVKPSLGSQEFPSSNDDYHSFTKFTKTDEVPITAQAAFESAAQAAFESAAYATEAGKAAVSLVKHKPLIKESTQSGKSWREADLESELDEAIEVALARSVCILGNNCEDNSSAKMGEACSIKSLRTRKNEKISVSHPGSGFAWVTSSQKVGINLNGEETLEDPVSLARAKQFQAYKYGQQHLEDYNDNAEESEFSANLKNRNLHVKQEYYEGIETHSKRSMFHSSSNKSNHYSSAATRPVFDDYDDDAHQAIYSGRNRSKSTLNAGRRSENCVPYIPSASDTSNRPKSEEDGRDEMIISRRRSEKQHDICQIERQSDKPRSEMRPRQGKDYDAEGEMNTSTHKSRTRPSKPLFKDFVRQEKGSFEDFNPQSVDDAGSINDFERMTFQYRNKASSIRRSHPEENYFVHSYKGSGEALQDYWTVEDRHIFLEDRRPWNGFYPAQQGISEDDRASQSLETTERSHLGVEQSVKKHNIHDIHFSNISKQRILRNDLLSKHDYEGPKEEEDSGIVRMRDHKPTHHGGSLKSVKMKQQSRSPQLRSLKIGELPPRIKEADIESTNTGYTTFHNPFCTSPTSLHSCKKSTYGTVINDSMHISSPFMRSLPSSPPPVGNIGEKQKENLNFSNIRSPSENIFSDPSKPCSDEKFSERLAVLRKKR